MSSPSGFTERHHSHGAFGEGPSGAASATVPMRRQLCSGAVVEACSQGSSSGGPALWKLLWAALPLLPPSVGGVGLEHSHIRCHRAGLPVVSEQEACVCLCTGEHSSKHACPIAQDTGKHTGLREPPGLGLQSVSCPNSHVRAFPQCDGSWRWGPWPVTRFLQDVIHVLQEGTR